MKTISFSPMYVIPKEFYPVPASKVIPTWYKEIESYMGGKKKPTLDGKTTATIKKCIPVFDALSAGYIIPTPADVYIEEIDGCYAFRWSNYELITFHENAQAHNHPKDNGHDFLKFSNPWAIKTPPGYSLLIVQPFHRESVFTIMPAVVDTDTYTLPINFPFTLNDKNFEGLIPAGTPMAQVIPFKRESWQMNIEHIENNEVRAKHPTTFFDRYKNMWWHKKEYK